MASRAQREELGLAQSRDNYSIAIERMIEYMGDGSGHCVLLEWELLRLLLF